MREILFRGKRNDTGEWVYGSLQVFKGYSIFDANWKNYFTVKGDTVGQFTGLLDKNGTRVFEGDIVKYAVHGSSSKSPIYRIGPVIFSDQCFMPLTFCIPDTLLVLGNVHDDPELIRENNK